MPMIKVGFINCEKCGKRLIERKPNGLWYFSFGKSNIPGAGAPVEIVIHGSLLIKCIRKSCNHWNVLNSFQEVAMEK